MLEKREFEKNDFMWRLSTTITLVSGVFSVVVFILLAVNYLQIRSSDPINDLLLTQLREDYAAAPERDAVLAQRIRELDLINRKAFFTSQGLLRLGGTLLLVGVIVFLLAFKNMARWRPAIQELSETPAAETEWQSHAVSRKLISWTCVVLLGIGLAASFLSERALDAVARTTVPDGASGAAVPLAAQEHPTWETMQLNWPTFRGPGATGVAHFTNAPVDWDVEEGRGIRWKTEVPLPGTNSPVVWGSNLFISGADDKTREVYCFDTETGKLRWKRTLAPFEGTPPAESIMVNPETGYASPTMVAHGDQVFAIFANRDIVSYDFDGNLIWGFSLGAPDNHYGHSSSLLAHGGLIYVQLDQMEDGKLLALDASTGEEAWVKEREFISWSSPILAHTPYGVQVVLLSEEDVDAYDAVSGELLWSYDFLGGEVAPSAAYSDGVVFAASDSAYPASAIRPTGSADAAKAEILWGYEDVLPDVSSPVGDGKHFYLATSYGDLVCLDAASGEEKWLEEVSDDGFYSSPVIAGDRLYIFDKKGTMHIIRAGAEYELIATMAMGEDTFATPAFMDGRIYVRTMTQLYCIEQPDA